MAGLAQGAAFYFTLRLQRLLIVFISSMRLERFEFSHHFGRNLLGKKHFEHDTGEIRPGTFTRYLFWSHWPHASYISRCSLLFSSRPAAEAPGT